MNEEALRRYLTNQGRDQEEIDAIAERWCSDEVDRRRDEEDEQGRDDD